MEAGAGGQAGPYFHNAGVLIETPTCPLSMRRPTAGPQSVSSSIRRKSTIYDHHSAAGGGGGVRNGPSTPERPLLYAFNESATGAAGACAVEDMDPAASLHGAASSPSCPGPLSQHIYMEVADAPQLAVAAPPAAAVAPPLPPPQSFSQPPPLQQRQKQHFQPIHIPILVERRTESSNSSQSSGYYSEYRPPSSSRELKLQQQQQQHKPKLDLPVATTTTALEQGRPLSPGRQLEIQDSQFI